ncbi:DUF2927 domain-containing protein [Falsirhodobacter algicola]|uniref:DUF2927 domain-containing protein n=1 Tax=Falsirhodobacter algicola TaxID=2692330 RepID=A0A8J8SKP4_9RHOB|nr:DUF2927 domain-containing protein [Falsirhodobacter algicola]QUS35652.1 DUF2927 domain-containing protein [Falsirhodobacter algicola]
MLRWPLLRGTTLLLLLLAACAKAPEPPTPVEPVRPKPRPERKTVEAPSDLSEALRRYYASVQSDLLSRGLMRTDGGGADTPFDDRILADTFVLIALRDEYARDGDGFVQRETPAPLRRWNRPVRVGLVFGDSVPERQRAIEKARIGSYLARLSRVSGHPIGLNKDHPNLTIFIVNEDERRRMGAAIAKAAPGLTPNEVKAVTDLPRETYCLAYATSDATSTYTGAFALIREEHPDLLSLACLHEEVAQAMGLANDSPRARPSIFNDDEEFALLTDMDELMLKILYDPRLRPGMTEEEARPIVQQIAQELMGAQS